MIKCRKVKIDHKNPPLWQSLSKEQKTRHNIFCSYLIKYCENNKNIYVPWADVDENIPHIYNFVFDDYNASHQKTRIRYDKIGVKIVDNTFNFEQNIVDLLNNLEKI